MSDREPDAWQMRLWDNIFDRWLPWIQVTAEYAAKLKPSATLQIRRLYAKESP